MQKNGGKIDPNRKEKRDDLSPNRQQKVVWKKVTLTTISNILMTNLILVNDWCGANRCQMSGVQIAALGDIDLVQIIVWLNDFILLG